MKKCFLIKKTLLFAYMICFLLSLSMNRVYATEISEQKDAPKYMEKQISSIQRYIGEWMDEYSQRCYMSISMIGGNHVNITATWGNSAYETGYWSAIGKYDTYTGCVEYAGVEYTLNYVGTEPQLSDCFGCNGTLYFEDGYLKWNNSGNYTGDCYFSYKGGTYTPSYYVTVTAPGGFVNFRSGPSTSDSIYMRIPAGACLGVITNTGKWSKVIYDGIEGYCNNTQISDPITFDYSFEEMKMAGEYEGINVMPNCYMQINIYSASLTDEVGNCTVLYPEAGMEIAGRLWRQGNKEFLFVPNGENEAALLTVKNATTGKIKLHYAEPNGFNFDFDMFYTYPIP